MGILTTTGERILAALYWQTPGTNAGVTLHEIAAALMEQDNAHLAPGDRATLSLMAGGYEYATVEIVMTPRPDPDVSPA